MAVERFLKLPAADTLMEKTGFFILLRHKLPLFFYFFFFRVLGLFFTEMKREGKLGLLPNLCGPQSSPSA